MDLYKIKLQIDDIKMQQELKKSMAFLTYPKNYSVESNCLYISEKQFILDGNVYQINPDKTVEKLPDDVSPKFDLDIICREHEKLLKRLINK